MAFRGLVGANIAFCCLRPQCLRSSATRELLIDCFDFDPQIWASVMVAPFKDWESGVFDLIRVVELQIWFQAQVCFPNLCIVYY